MGAWALGGATETTPRWLHVAAIVTAPVVCAVLYLADPSGSSLYPLCPFRAMTGLYCPGCGTLRAGNRLLHGRVDDALALNPLAVLAVPVVMYALASSFLLVIWGRALPRIALRSGWIWMLVAIVVSFGVVRNIPVHPFTLLAP